MAWSDARCRVFDADFKLTLFFREIPAEAAEPPPPRRDCRDCRE